MIHFITTQNRSFYTRELERLHRARKEVFVDELGWKLRVKGGLEFDEYDDERAMSVVGFDMSGDVAMGIRMRPADDRSMLVDHFSHVLPAGIRPIDDGRTWEVSRGFCRERGLKRHHRMRKAAIMLAPLEIAHAAGIDRFVGFTDVRILSFYNHIGWKLNLLGSAMPYGEGDGVAYEAEVSSRVINEMRQTWGLPAPSYMHVETLPEGASVHEIATQLAHEDPVRTQLLPQAAEVPLPMNAARPLGDGAHYRANYRMAARRPLQVVRKELA